MSRRCGETSPSHTRIDCPGRLEGHRGRRGDRRARLRSRDRATDSYAWRRRGQPGWRHSRQLFSKGPVRRELNTSEFRNQQGATCGGGALPVPFALVEHDSLSALRRARPVRGSSSPRSRSDLAPINWSRRRPAVADHVPEASRVDHHASAGFPTSPLSRTPDSCSSRRRDRQHALRCMRSPRPAGAAAALHRFPRFRAWRPRR